MQNCKIEQNEQQTIQQQNNATTAQQIQVMPTVLGHTASGQQILLQSLQQNIGANGQQQIQVVPIHGLGHHQGGTIIVQQQPQVQQPQPQIVQLPDGQFYISQPILPETQAQTQIVNINGNFYQIPTQHQQAPAQNTSQNTATLQGSPASNVQATQNPSQNQQVVMMTTSAPTVSSPVQNDSQGNVTNLIGTNSSSVSPPPNSSSPTPAAESEEEPLYVNASKLI